MIAAMSSTPKHQSRAVQEQDAAALLLSANLANVDSALVFAPRSDAHRYGVSKNVGNGVKWHGLEARAHVRRVEARRGVSTLRIDVLQAGQGQAIAKMFQRSSRKPLAGRPGRGEAIYPYLLPLRTAPSTRARGCTYQASRLEVPALISVDTRRTA
ncbi:hypothetical protein NPX13_g6646 [Xylaria arbuscula]|uniref:Uncharacterized protein n=1 Tax=Xylaria arbuscula TaxID=114810 RepID=A0A9W8TL78_9PEZI|nr:hypothetical protein NPX13_g6646 [Xylaria arbuscula]